MTLDTSSSWFDTLGPMLSRIAIDPLPDAEALQAALGSFIAPMRFESQTKKKSRARRAAIDVDALYEARIARRGLIPTRTHLHDLMNALVWATFPRSKHALADRQARALFAQVGERPAQLPNARTRARDVLAMIDEGGLILLEGETRVFGHAIYEHLATSDTSVRGFPIRLPLPRTATNVEVDAALAAWLERLDADAARTVGAELDRTTRVLRIEGASA